MATVPNDPSTPVDVIPKYLRPTPADFLQAAAIVDQRQRMAGDIVDMPGAKTPGQRISGAMNKGELNKITTQQTLMRALGGGAKVLPITPNKGE
jgi:hypothetical protein